MQRVDDVPVGVFCMWGVENISDRYRIRTTGGYWVHQVPSEPGRGNFNSQRSC